MKGLKLFLTISVIVLLLVVTAFIFLYLTWIGKDSNPLSKPDKVQALTSILALLISSGAVIGSAIATLRIASLGLEISSQQERRDYIAFVDLKAENCIKIFSSIAIVLGDLHSSAVTIDEWSYEAVNAAKKKYIAVNKTFDREKDTLKLTYEYEKYLSQYWIDNLGIALESLTEKLESLKILLHDLLKDDLSRSCFYKMNTMLKSKVSYLNDCLLKNDNTGEERYNLQFETANLSDFAGMLDLMIRRIKTYDFTDIMEVRTTNSMPDTPLMGLPYNNSNVRSLMFLGYLMFTRTKTAPIRIANYGAAMIYDLFHLLPDKNVIKSVLDKKYNKLFEINHNYKIDFEPKKMSSIFFNKALTDIEIIGDLYYLDGGK